MAEKNLSVLVSFKGDTTLVKRAQNEIKRENRVTQDEIRKDQNKTIKNLFDQTNKIKGHFTNLSNKTLGVLGLGFGLHGLVSSAGQFIGQIGRVGDELTGLSDQFGSVNKAVGIYYSGLGSSFASMGQVKSAMMALGNEGIKIDGNFKALTFQIADLSQITGISADSMAGLAGVMKGFGMATSKDLREVMNSVISIGLNGHQAAQVVQTIGKAIENLGYYAKDGGKSVKALATGISESTSYLTKFGVRAQTANTFMDKLTDPAQYGEMASLLNRMNISQADYFAMLRTESGKKSFFDKLQQNLPAIADQIMSIQNPMAQMDFAKSIGVPMEIAAKLAGKTKGEIQGILKQSQTDKAAIAKKESQGKANQERFSEMLEMFKMNALMPLMQFMMRNMPNFIKFVSLISDFVKGALQTATGYMGKFQDTINGVFNKSNSLGELLTNAIGPIFQVLGSIIGNAISAFFTLSNWSKVFSGIWTAMTKMPWYASLIAGFLLFRKVGGFIVGMTSGFNRGSAANPMVTREVGSLGGGGSLLGRKRSGLALGKRTGGLIGKAKGVLGKIPGAARIGGMLGSLGGVIARFAGPIGLAITALTALYSVFNTYTNATEKGKEVLKDAGMAFLKYITGYSIVTGQWSENNQKLINGLGLLFGTQEHYNEGLTATEAIERRELIQKKESGQLTDKQIKRLDVLNTQMEKANVSGTDIFAQMLAKIGGLFSTDGLMSAKIALALNNFGTWLGAGFSAMIRGLKRSLGILIPGYSTGANEGAMNTFETQADNEVARAGRGEGNSEKLKQLRDIAAAYATSMSTQWEKDFYGDKARELTDRMNSMRQYEERAKKQKDIEAAERHKQTMGALGGIGASTAKTAENTMPEKNAVREAFKDFAITNTQVMETQYAGSSFSSK